MLLSRYDALPVRSEGQPDHPTHDRTSLFSCVPYLEQHPRSAIRDSVRTCPGSDLVAHPGPLSAAGVHGALNVTEIAP